MTTRRWTEYNIPSAAAYKMRDGEPPMASAATDGALVNAVVANYAQCRRNQLACVYNVGHTHTWTEEDIAKGWIEWFHIPIGHRIIRTGNDKQLKIWLYYQNTVSEAGDREVLLRAELDSGDAGEVSLANIGWTWTSFTIDLTNQVECDEYITFFYQCEIDAANQMNDVEIKCVCAYQEQTAATPAHVDLAAANNYLATSDYPNGCFALKLLRDSTEAIREQKCIKANVFAHWWGAMFNVGLYAANNDGLGRYKLVKRSGVSQVKVRTLCAKAIGDPNWTVRTEIIGHGNNTSIVNSATLTWYEHTYNFAGANITDELELELLIDGNEAGGMATQYCPGVFVWEVPSVAVAHAVPNPLNYQSGGVIDASEHDNIRDTNDHLWNRGACQILCSDWRVSLTQDNLLYNNDAAQNKQDFGESVTTMVARTIVFPSESSTRLRVRMGYNTTSGSTRIKHITMQISGNHAVFTTWDDVCERWEDMTNGDYQFSEAVTDKERVISCELDIPSADWETINGTAPANLEIYINAWTDNTSEYVLPNWVAVEEIELAATEFP